MVRSHFLGALYLFAIRSPTSASVVRRGYDDLLYRVTLPVTPAAELVAPEWIPVPSDFIAPIDTRESSLGLNTTELYHPGAEERDVIGDDNRFLWEGTDYPFKPQGRVTFNTSPTSGVICSGVLIGPRHVLTARHCVGDGTWTNGRFAPSYDNGERFGSAAVTGVIVDPDYNFDYLSPCWVKNDYAIMILDQRIGDQVGYMFLFDVPDETYFNQPILNSCGYPGDKGANQLWCQYGRTPWGYGGCDATGPVTTDIDAISGQSGSAVWQQRPDGSLWLWGVVSVGSSGSTVIASGDVMLLGFKFAIAAFP